MRTRIAIPGKSNAGFTFVEILASMLFLAILIPTVMSALALSSRAGVLSDRTSTAIQLAENRLAEVLADETWMTGTGNGGDFGQDWPGYRWDLKNSDWPEDTMTELTVTVYFEVQGREQSVQLTTLASDTPVQP